MYAATKQTCENCGVRTAEQTTELTGAVALTNADCGAGMGPGVMRRTPGPHGSLLPTVRPLIRLENGCSAWKLSARTYWLSTVRSQARKDATLCSQARKDATLCSQARKDATLCLKPGKMLRHRLVKVITH